MEPPQKYMVRVRYGGKGMVSESWEVSPHFPSEKHSLTLKGEHVKYIFIFYSPDEDLTKKIILHDI